MEAPFRLGRCILFEKFNGIADGPNRFRVIVRNDATKFLLELHHELDRIEAVGSKIVNEARASGTLVGFVGDCAAKEGNTRAGV